MIFKGNKKTSIASVIASSILILLANTSNANDIGSEQKTNTTEPLKQDVQKARLVSALVDEALNSHSEEEKYKGIVALIQKYGQWVVLSNNKTVVHISAYLLLKDQEDLAISLLKNNAINGFVSYEYDDSVVNDFILSVQASKVNYIKALFDVMPSMINSEFVIKKTGEKVLPIALLASKQYQHLPMYKEMLITLLNAGALPFKNMSNGLSAMVVAKTTGNTDFVRVVQDYTVNGNKTNSLFKNTPLEAEEMIQDQAITDVFLEKSPEEIASYSFEELYNIWVQMILKGYNTTAETIYNEIKKRQEFDINAPSKNGITPIMACVLSSLHGGNVEYLKLLVERGANPKDTIDINIDGQEVPVNYIQLAFQKDNYKTVAYLITQGVDFVLAPDNKETFLLAEALAQKAYLSASIIKEVLEKELAK
jgi:hypothetical protein